MSVTAPPPRPTSPPALPRRVVAPLVAVLTVGTAVVWQGADRQPSDANTPVALRGETTAAPAGDRTIRIGTFNIHGGRGPDGVAALDVTAEVLREGEMDFVGLNEVHGAFGGDQAIELGGRLGMASVFAGTERRWWRDHIGNGLLTRRPLRGVLRIALPGTQEKQYRNAVLSTTEVGGTPVRILATHIDRKTDRDLQLATVLELFRSLESPAVLTGDLNATARQSPLAALLAEPDVVDAVAEKLGPQSQTERVDHLITRGLIVIDAGVIETPASDHPHVWAELALP